MTYIRRTILVYFLTDILNWQVVWGKEKYLLNILYEKLKNNVSLIQMWTVKYLSLRRTNKKSSINLKELEKFWKLKKIIRKKWAYVSTYACLKSCVRQ